MRRGRLPLILLLLLASLGGCRDGGAEGGGPRLVVDEPEVDFGPVFSTESRHHDFVLRNAGTRPLKIHRIKKDCGCTQPVLSRAEIPPGETARLAVDFKPPYLGEVAKRIWIFSDGGQETVLWMRARSYGVARIDPPVIDLAAAREAHPDGRVPVEIVVAEGETIEDARFGETSPEFTLRPLGPPTGGRARFELVLAPPVEPAAYRDAIPVWLTLRGQTAPQRLPFGLQITGRIAPAHWFDPPVLNFGAAEGGTSRTRRLRLVGAEATTPELRAPADSGLEIRPVGAGEWDVTLRFPVAGRRIAGRLELAADASSDLVAPRFLARSRDG
ncbi:MAG: DUF1573 domain-containing protein [Planctomycetota bacterium]